MLLLFLPGTAIAQLMPTNEARTTQQQATGWDLADAGNASEKFRSIWLVDDFEDGLDPGWTDPPGGGTASIDTIGADGTSHSLRVDGSGAYALWYDLGNQKPSNISLFIRSASASEADTYVIIGDDSTTSNNGAIFFHANSSGYLLAISDSVSYNCGPYSAVTWYQIDFAIDWPCQVFDVYVDSVLKKSGVPFNNPVASFTQLHVGNLTDSTAWWDQIMLSTPPPSMAIFSDDFERGGTCHWSSSVN